MRLFYLRSDPKVPRIVATLAMAEIECELVPVTDHDLSTMSEMRTLSPLGLTPILQAEGVALFTVGPILKHLARVKREKGLAGLLLREESQVLPRDQIDQWVDLCNNELEPLTATLLESFSTGVTNPAVANSGLKEISKILSVLEARFRDDHKCLVGYGASIADISISTVLTIPFWPIYRDYLASSFPAVTRWLRECQERFDFASVAPRHADPREDPVWSDHQVPLLGRHHLLPQQTASNGQTRVRANRRLAA